MSHYLLIFYCLAIIAASWMGGYLPSILRLTHTRMQAMISFVGGLMLGVGLLHLLPHGIAQISQSGPPNDVSQATAVDLAIGCAIIGLLFMFFLIRIFHFHQHDTGGLDSDAQHDESPSKDSSAHAHSEDDVHSQGVHSHGGHDHSHSHDSHRFSWSGVAIGLALHTMIDGVALGAAVAAEAEHSHTFGLFGVATFLAILLHKPLDALSITSLMVVGGWSARARQIVNVAFSLMCPAGVALFYFGMTRVTGGPELYVGCALGFSAGVFLCISLGDLLPEVQFHTHDRVKLSVALLLGVLLAYGIGFIEPSHEHMTGHGAHPPAQSEHDNHDGHKHP